MAWCIYIYLYHFGALHTVVVRCGHLTVCRYRYIRDENRCIHIDIYMYVCMCVYIYIYIYRYIIVSVPSRGLSVGPASILGPKKRSLVSIGGVGGPGRARFRPVKHVYICVYLYERFIFKHTYVECRCSCSEVCAPIAVCPGPLMTVQI